MMNKTIFPVLFIFLMSVWATVPAVAQDGSYRIGFVNTARVLKEAPQARRVEERLKAEFEPREIQIREMREEVISLEDGLKASDQVTNSSRRKLERELRLKVSQLKFLEQEFREDQNLRRNEEIRELQRVIAEVLEQQGDEGAFDLILTEGVSYVSDAVDITGQTIELLKLRAESEEAAE